MAAQRIGRETFILIVPIMLFLLVQGCVATRGWVTDQIAPLAERTSEGVAQVSQMGNRLSGAEGLIGQMAGRVSGIEDRLDHVDARTEKALGSLANLRLERRLVLDLKDGANFAFNSAGLTEGARKEIDSFLSDLKGDLDETREGVFLVAGHTDSVGSEEYNYELGRRRAESVARYLITHKKLDPLKVVTVSYGKSQPLTGNATPEGRSKNRRVEILVFKETIATSPAETASRAEAKFPEGSRSRIDTR